MKNSVLKNEKGFALLAAIIASLILIAVSILVINMSTGDLRASAASVGTKKAHAAAESGIHNLMKDFDPDPATWTEANGYTAACTVANPNYVWQETPSGKDKNSKFATCAPTAANAPPLPIPGFSQEWGMMRYNATVVGTNTAYNSAVTVDVGIGYGPVPMN